MTAPYLATYGAINVHEAERLQRCPRVDHDRIWWVNRRTGEIRWDRCRAMLCPFCSSIELALTAEALAHGGTTGPPTHAFRLSLDHRDWPRIRQKMANLPRYLENKGCRGWCHAFVVHQGGRGRFHLHGLMKGCEKISEATLARTWGSGVHVESIANPYAAARYLFHHADSHPAVLRHLDLNGGRAEHHSRAYFGQWRLDTTKRFLSRGSEGWTLVRNDASKGA